MEGASPNGLFRRESRFDPETFVVAVGNQYPLALRPRAKVQGVIGIRIDGKPVLAIKGLAHRSEARKQVFRLGGPDLRYRLTLHPHDVVLLLIHPDHAIEEPLAVQNLPWTHL